MAAELSDGIKMREVNASAGTIWLLFVRVVTLAKIRMCSIDSVFSSGCIQQYAAGAGDYSHLFTPITIGNVLCDGLLGGILDPDEVDKHYDGRDLS